MQQTMAQDLVDQVRCYIERHGLLSRGDTVVVGVSGGPDSLCLLHVLCALSGAYDLHLHVAHLNHQLRGADADADATFVVQTCQDWTIPVTVESLPVGVVAKERGLAVEEAARQIRYAFLGRVAAQVGAQKVAVGHNADDQVETVLMHWLRGSGLAGLRGMLPLTRLDEMRLSGFDTGGAAYAVGPWLIRPLLATPRRAIEAYCAAHDLQPRFDRSNLDTTLFRNRLRHELLPVLETFNPRFREVALRSADILAADYACLRQLQRQTWQELEVSETSDRISLRLSRWRGLPLSLQRSVLREVIHRLRRSLRNINWVHTENALAVLASGHTGIAATLPGGLEARIEYDRLQIARAGAPPELPDTPWVDQPLHIAVPGETALPGSAWILTTRVVPRASLAEETIRSPRTWQAFLDHEAAGTGLQLRPRRSGDRFWPQGLGDRPGSLNAFMTSAKIPRAWRDRLPLLMSPRGILWLPGWRISELARIRESTRLVLVAEFVRGSGHGSPVANGSSRQGEDACPASL